MNGRPSIFSDELSSELCCRIAEGKSLRSICREDDMPAMATVFRWIGANPSFREQYEVAMEQRSEAMFEEILEISDDGRNDTYMGEDGVERTSTDVIARSRLRVDARKWMLSKMVPKKYGDKLTQELTGKDGAPLVTAIEVSFVNSKG